MGYNSQFEKVMENANPPNENPDTQNLGVSMMNSTHKHKKRVWLISIGTSLMGVYAQFLSKNWHNFLLETIKIDIHL